MMMMIVQKLDFSYFFPGRFNAQEINLLYIARLRVF